jgi:hypothetical protein
MKKIILFLLILIMYSSCVVEPIYNCECTTKVYEVTEFNGQVIESQLVGYQQVNDDCRLNGEYYITNVVWNGPYKHYTLYETYCN